MESLSCWRVEGLMSCHMAQIVMCMSCYRVNHTSCISVRWGLLLNVASPPPRHTVLYLAPAAEALTCWTYRNGGRANKLLMKHGGGGKSRALTASSSARLPLDAFCVGVSEIIVD